MKATVVVPTFRRPNDLYRCLEALKQQKVLPHEVIVIVRPDDQLTWTMLEQFQTEHLPLRTETVDIPGVVAAMNIGLEKMTGDIVCFTDDDAAPHPDWIERIIDHFERDSGIGGVGGKDNIQNPQPWFKGTSHLVGQLQWYGRMIGNHHKGIGQAQEVDILKGVNMSFRHQAIDDLRFDTRMLGTGAQVHFEVAFCLNLKRQGWKLLYDPLVQVDHYLAQRHDEDQRSLFSEIAQINAVHNETLIILENLTLLQKVAFLSWSIVIGTTQSFGILQWLRYLPSQRDLSTQKLLASVKGRWQGLRSWYKYQRIHN